MTPLRSFFIIWAGQAFSLLGSSLVQFALIWWLTDTTGSATVLALASLVGLLPQIVLGPFMGVLVDRWDRRRIMLASDATVALATLLLAYLFWRGSAGIGHVFAILFVRSLGGGFHWFAMQTSTSLMVPEEHLTRVQGLNQTLNGGLNIVGAPLGALLLSVLPLQAILAIDVVTALIAITPLLFIAIPRPVREAAAADGPFWRSFTGELLDGLRYVRARRALMLLMLTAGLINLLLHPAFALLPILVTDHFQGEAIHLGGLEAAIGVGIVSGGLLLSVWGGFRRRIVTTLVGVSSLGVAFVLTSLTPTNLFGAAIVTMFIAGIAIAFTDGPLMAIVQATVAPEMQGRVFTLLLSIAKIMSPLGLVVAGPAADLVGVRTWYLVSGIFTLIVALGSALSPVLLNIETDRTQPVPAALPAD
ncbi:MAG: MFS transporter [Chloroflexi bacterium]|jgi:DHA3 family macrolide efflux protein-like MFS transporter|nr:MFS transporter [Chloroflexota bacterium]